MNNAGPRILVSPVGEAGRAVQAFPLFCALRKKFPSAHITWALPNCCESIARAHPAIDRLIEVPADWRRSPLAVASLHTLLSQHRFDISLDLGGTLASAMFNRLSQAPMRIGPAASFRQPWRGLNTDRVVPVFQHVTDRWLELLIPLGVHSPRVQWNVPVSKATKQWAARLRQRIGTDRLVLFSPFAPTPTRQWEAARFAAASRYLRGRYGYRTMVLWSDAPQRCIGSEIVRASDGAAVLAPAADLPHQAALIETAELLIGVDSTPLHLAAALDTACIGLYGATRRSQTGPYGQSAVQTMFQRPSRHRSGAPSNPAMRAIAVLDLCNAIDQLHEHRRILKVA